MSTPQGYHYHTIEPQQLAARIAAGVPPRILDLREPFEVIEGRIPGSELMPLSQLQRWWRELDPSQEMVLQCRRGNRSRALCCALAVEGFSRLSNLEGGLEGWLEADGNHDL